MPHRKGHVESRDQFTKAVLAGEVGAPVTGVKGQPRTAKDLKRQSAVDVARRKFELLFGETVKGQTAEERFAPGSLGSRFREFSAQAFGENAADAVSFEEFFNVSPADRERLAAIGGSGKIDLDFTADDAAVAPDAPAEVKDAARATEQVKERRETRRRFLAGPKKVKSKLNLSNVGGRFFLLGRGA